MIELFTEKKHCCGCAACMNICPKKAITMKTDDDGFMYPQIDTKLCVKCGLCTKVCAFQKETVKGKEPIACFAAINKNEESLIESASGGVFAALASYIIQRGGVVYGCSYDDDMMPHHIGIDNIKDIKKLQGSKYVQSTIDFTFLQVKRDLMEGKKVLFTGTPCQVAGLKSFLGKGYDNLITADIICHGVPNAAFFKGYISYLEDKLGGKIIDFRFRDKSRGWGLMGKAVYKKNNKVKHKLIHPVTSYYYSYFLKGDIYRENCYECKYACSHREGDFTLGDYWGVQKFHPELEVKKGVSVLLINSRKAMDIKEELSEYINLTESSFNKAREKNDQLKEPAAKSGKREDILKIWREGGHKAAALDYYKKNKKKILDIQLRMCIPKSVKVLLKKSRIK